MATGRNPSFLLDDSTYNHVAAAYIGLDFSKDMVRFNGNIYKQQKCARDGNLSEIRNASYHAFKIHCSMGCAG